MSLKKLINFNHIGVIHSNGTQISETIEIESQISSLILADIADIALAKEGSSNSLSEIL